MAALCLGGQPLCQALHAAARAPLVPIPEGLQPAGCAYEQHVFQTGTVPVREGLHDYFNGLAWHLFPGTKQRMNALQAAEIARRGIGPARGPLRDRLTVMDESGAFLHAPDPLWHALAAKNWQQAFGTLRPLWQHSRLWILGHALLEQLATPRKNLTAHVWRLHAPCADSAAVDALVVASLLHADHAPAAGAHLPVLGVPGWHRDNQNPDFYADGTVFRPPRAGTASDIDAAGQ